jgi:hypothetical protein
VDSPGYPADAQAACSHNFKLLQICFIFGMIEDVGTGILTVYEEMNHKEARDA